MIREGDKVIVLYYCDLTDEVRLLKFPFKKKIKSFSHFYSFKTNNIRRVVKLKNLVLSHHKKGSDLPVEDDSQVEQLDTKTVFFLWNSKSSSSKHQDSQVHGDQPAK